ncbi:class I SAM-dependent methyltransferase [Pseudoroseicyclus sp. CXY001]|uniref:class I SAM-dependent methyltransferase n=1 Tax=Pseudoroseicyclus sp. CXY001 TaxID=3242492 RepID=UPI00358DB759
MIRRPPGAPTRFLAACEAVEAGQLNVTLPGGQERHYGSGPRAAHLELNDWAAAPPLLSQRPDLLAESFARGLWHSPEPEALARLFAENRAAFPLRPGPLASGPLRALQRCPAGLHPGPGRGRGAPLPGNEFFQLFLDPGMSFTAALFQPGDDDLGRAQSRKYDRVLDRIGGAPRLLDMSCGWGGLLERAAARGLRATGLAEHPAQASFTDARLDGRAEVRLAARGAPGRYGGIAAIEPAGSAALPRLLAEMRARLADGGRALLQSVTHGPEEEARLTGLAVLAGLAPGQRFAFGADYARTLRHWSARLEAARPRALALGFGEDMLRRWRWQFDSAAAAFALGQRQVVQIELTHAGEAGR